jgi:hypothetical protein
MTQERAHRTVIRNLHYSTPIAQITAELEKQGHKVRNILNVKHCITKEPLSLFFIDLEPKENNKGIYDMEFLCSMKIIVEAPRPEKHIVQCTRSQSYGHTKAYYAKPYACVKCGGNHNTSTCTKTPSTPAKYALCGGNHPASCKGCEVYKNLQQNRGKSFNRVTHRPILPKISVHDTNQFPLNQPKPNSESHAFRTTNLILTSPQTKPAPPPPNIRPANTSYIRPIINLPHRV